MLGAGEAVTSCAQAGLLLKAEIAAAQTKAREVFMPGFRR